MTEAARRAVTGDGSSPGPRPEPDRCHRYHNATVPAWRPGDGFPGSAPSAVRAIRMSVPAARVSVVAERWDRARVLALAPDASSQRAAQSLTSGRAWAASGASPGASAGASPGASAGASPGASADASAGAGTGAGPAALWGECRGSASAPYLTVIDLSGPAYRCSCPSRKFPCKHALALLLLWADGSVPEAAGEPPGWAAGWLAARAAKAGAAKAGAAGERD